MYLRASLALLCLLCAGCFSIKTEHEIKPIHITVDVNLKVQKELDNVFAELDQASSTRTLEPAAK